MAESNEEVLADLGDLIHDALGEYLAGVGGGMLSSLLVLADGIDADGHDLRFYATLPNQQPHRTAGLVWVAQRRLDNASNIDAFVARAEEDAAGDDDEEGYE